MAQHIYDLRPSTPDSRDYILTSVAAQAGAPLPTFTVNPVPPFKDQGQEGSCTGFSLSSVREYLLVNSDKAPYTALSPAWMYWWERSIEGSTTQDGGANIRDGLNVMTKKGFAPEIDFPYKAGAYTVKPPQAANRDAGHFKAKMYHRIPTLDALRQTLAAGLPAVFGIVVYESFERVGADGLVPMPTDGEQVLGGHAIAAFNYKDDPSAPGGGWVELHNSWGAGAGKNGSYFVPYAFVADTRYTFEMWGVI
jgi:hypothetical protein